MTIASVAGLVFTNKIYPTEELRRTFVSNDGVNLCIGLPILLGSMALARRSRWIGLLLWPGALFYTLYNYLVAILSMPPNGFYLLVAALVVICVYTLARLFASLDSDSIRQRLSGLVKERFSGGILAGLSGLFLVMAIGEIIQAIASQTPLPRTELALHITDSLFAAVWIVSGIALWQRRAIGYAAGLGLLFQFSMLFVGLLFYMLLQPVLTGEAYPLADLLFIVILGLVCFIPFAIFARGVISAERRLKE
jgi:hypothetical protein